MELVFNILGAVAMIWNMLTVAIPVMVGWAIIGLLGVFAILFLYVFFTVRG
jgi:hypothetical protein